MKTQAYKAPFEHPVVGDVDEPLPGTGGDAAEAFQNVLDHPVGNPQPVCGQAARDSDQAGFFPDGGQRRAEAGTLQPIQQPINKLGHNLRTAGIPKQRTQPRRQRQTTSACYASRYNSLWYLCER